MPVQSTTATTGGTPSSNGQQRPQPTVESQIDQCCGEVQQFVEENPTAAVVTVFAAGMGLGVLAAGLLSAGSSKRNGVVSKAEDLGQKLMDAMSGVLPDALKQ